MPPRAAALLALLALLAPGLAAAQPWVLRAPLQEPRQEVAVAALDGRLYVIGGFRADLSIADTVEVYDPEADAWSFAPPLPTPVHHAAAAAVDGVLYVFGGWSDLFQTPLAEVHAFDPAAGEWSPREPMPAARGSLAAAALGGLVYTAGGSPADREQDLAVYDPVADEWTELPAMPTPRNHLALVALEGRLHAVGGRTATILPVPGAGAHEVYDPATGEWEEEPPLPTPRSGIAAAAFAGRLLVFGGEGAGGAPGTFREVEAWDPDTEKWSPLPPMPTGRHGIGAAVLADGVHVPGGGPVQGFGVTGVHEVFVPEPAGGLPVATAALALLGLRRWRARAGAGPALNGAGRRSAGCR
jgi:hypothetical protein